MMREHRDNEASRHAARLYAFLLRLYPRSHRQAFGAQMLQTFQDHYREAVEVEGERMLLFWLGVFRDASTSVVNEHYAALAQRRWPMKKILLSLLLVALAVIVLVLVNLPAHSAAGEPGLPVNDPLWRPILETMMLVLTLSLYAGLIAAIVQVMRRVARAESRLNWMRFGLVLGGIVSLYAALLNVLSVLLPFDGYSGDQFLVRTLPLLLAGIIGMIGSYTSGAMRGGVLAGLLAGLLYELVSQLSWVLVIVLAWPAIQHGLLSSGVEGDFQRFAQATGHPPDLGAFLNLELFEDGIGLPLIFGLIAVTLEALCATLGAAIGAGLGRADARRRQVSPSGTRPLLSTALPVKTLLLTLALDLLVWIMTVEFNALGGAHRLFGLGDVGATFVNQTLGLWLLGLVAVLAFVLISTWFAADRPKPALATS